MHFSDCPKYALLLAKKLFEIDMFPLGIVSIHSFNMCNFKFNGMVPTDGYQPTVEKTNNLALCPFCEKYQLMAPKIR